MWRASAGNWQRWALTEILLDNAAYPTAGQLEYIKRGENYDESRFSQVLDAFYAKVREALKDYPEVKLSLSAGGAALTGAGDKSGQTARLLGKYADRLISQARRKPRGGLPPIRPGAGGDGAVPGPDGLYLAALCAAARFLLRPNGGHAFLPRAGSNAPGPVTWAPARCFLKTGWIYLK